MIRQVFNSAAERAAAMEKYPIVMVEDNLSPEELAQFHAQRERFNRNSAWLAAHGPEVYAQHKGRHICVAGEELYVADTALEAIALAKAAHPEDDGRLLKYLSPIPGPRIYAYQRPMATIC
jgi:hypothetical protein